MSGNSGLDHGPMLSYDRWLCFKFGKVEGQTPNKDGRVDVENTAEDSGVDVVRDRSFLTGSLVFLRRVQGWLLGEVVFCGADTQATPQQYFGTNVLLTNSFTEPT